MEEAQQVRLLGVEVAEEPARMHPSALGAVGAAPGALALLLPSPAAVEESSTEGVAEASVLRPPREPGTEAVGAAAGCVKGVEEEGVPFELRRSWARSVRVPAVVAHPGPALHSLLCLCHHYRL